MRTLPIGIVLLGLTAFTPALGSHDGKGGELVERGRYIVRIAGCNDCHTAGYAQAGGDVPEREWLKGSRRGWRGPWGTTYADNLRLYFAELSEQEWLERVEQLETRPPMPWFGLRAMTTRDQRAIYRYIRHLGPAGEQMPEFVPPGREPEGPYVQFPDKE